MNMNAARQYAAVKREFLDAMADGYWAQAVRILRANPDLLNDQSVANAVDLLEGR